MAAPQSLREAMLAAFKVYYTPSSVNSHLATLWLDGSFTDCINEGNEALEEESMPLHHRLEVKIWLCHAWISKDFPDLAKEMLEEAIDLYGSLPPFDDVESFPYALETLTNYKQVLNLEGSKAATSLPLHRVDGLYNQAKPIKMTRERTPSPPRAAAAGLGVPAGTSNSPKNALASATKKHRNLGFNAGNQATSDAGPSSSRSAARKTAEMNSDSEESD